MSGSGDSSIGKGHRGSSPYGLGRVYGGLVMDAYSVPELRPKSGTTSRAETIYNHIGFRSPQDIRNPTSLYTRYPLNPYSEVAGKHVRQI